MGKRILLIGDTILNITYRALPPREGTWCNPFTFLNEELLEQEGPDERSIQGIGYIARYLAAADPKAKPLVCSQLESPTPVPEAVSSVRDACDPESQLRLLGGAMPTVVRVLRNVASSHAHGPAPDYRPQLRLDSRRGDPPELDDALESLVKRLAPGDVCLVRTTTLEFLAASSPGEAKPSSYDDLSRCVERRVERLQQRLRDAEISAILDLRPIPRGLAIVDPRTIVSTTISRLMEFSGAAPDADPMGAIEQAFWKLSPACALLCFVPQHGAVLCVRDPGLPSKAQIYTVPIDAREHGRDGCGMVVGGDAFVAAFAATLLAEGTATAPIEALRQANRMAAGALHLALQRELGAQLSPADVTPLAERGPARPIERTSPLDAIKLTTAGGPDVFWKPTIVAPKGGGLRAQFEKLEGLIREWQPRPGSDLIAIFGESRCGKEYPLKKLLEALDYKPLQPVNMFQFLQDPQRIIRHLKREGANSVLIIDEVMPGDAGRSILNLTADKTYRAFGHADEDIEFKAHLVIILSSIEPRHLLSDLHGRLLGYVEIPPLRSRVEEIPHVLQSNLQKGLGPEKLPGIKVGFKALSALMSHDYRGRWSKEAQDGTGLNQQNFRALQDILVFAYRRAKARPRDADGDVRISAGDLPAPLLALAYQTETDERGLRYGSGLCTHY